MKPKNSIVDLMDLAAGVAYCYGAKEEVKPINQLIDVLIFNVEFGSSAENITRLSDYIYRRIQLIIKSREGDNYKMD